MYRLNQFVLGSILFLSLGVLSPSTSTLSADEKSNVTTNDETLLADRRHRDRGWSGGGWRDGRGWGSGNYGYYRPYYNYDRYYYYPYSGYYNSYYPYYNYYYNSTYPYYYNYYGSPSAGLYFSW